MGARNLRPAVTAWRSARAGRISDVRKSAARAARRPPSAARRRRRLGRPRGRSTNRQSDAAASAAQRQTRCPSRRRPCRSGIDRLPGRHDGRSGRYRTAPPPQAARCARGQQLHGCDQTRARGSAQARSAQAMNQAQYGPETDAFEAKAARNPGHQHQAILADPLIGSMKTPQGLGLILDSGRVSRRFRDNVPSPRDVPAKVRRLLPSRQRPAPPAR